jgi:hypothetical protein
MPLLAPHQGRESTNVRSSAPVAQEQGRRQGGAVSERAVRRPGIDAGMKYEPGT